ncbi:hypothetical protein [Frigoriglobus tundricola]|uniref:EF-hand domain-containing protein n=1 Tax=Frigoriglobus tundricola TaxID=2774151 RepID=A0A6M5YK20_9BACT|nr:hypothetical protein [Frigoriglobus tundricola]QJW93924.1 hypothetical protein FTUN_1438 [Frigoriglobus tundricola]
MRNVVLWLTSALMAALVSGGAAVSQPPVPKDGGFQRDGGPGRPGPGIVVRDDIGPGRLGADDVVTRIMAFDKNKDGKVTKDELPERMHDLIARGDTNKDGALDRDEIQKLVAAQAPGTGAPGRPGGGRDVPIGGAGPGPGPGAVGGFRADGTRAPGAPGGPFLIGESPGRGGVEGVVDDLKLSGPKKEEARAVAKEHQENVRKLMEQARADMLQKMKKVLSAEEFKDFQAALDRPGGGDNVLIGARPDTVGPGEAERKLEKLQKELDELRRQLRR